MDSFRGEGGGFRKGEEEEEKRGGGGGVGIVRKGGGIDGERVFWTLFSLLFLSLPSKVLVCKVGNAADYFYGSWSELPRL